MSSSSSSSSDIYSYLQDEALKSLEETTKKLLVENKISFDALLTLDKSDIKDLNISIGEVSLLFKFAKKHSSSSSSSPTTENAEEEAQQQNNMNSSNSVEKQQNSHIDPNINSCDFNNNNNDDNNNNATAAAAASSSSPPQSPAIPVASPLLAPLIAALPKYWKSPYFSQENQQNNNNNSNSNNEFERVSSGNSYSNFTSSTSQQQQHHENFNYKIPIPSSDPIFKKLAKNIRATCIHQYLGQGRDSQYALKPHTGLKLEKLWQLESAEQYAKYCVCRETISHHMARNINKYSKTVPSLSKSREVLLQDYDSSFDFAHELFELRDDVNEIACFHGVPNKAVAEVICSQGADPRVSVEKSLFGAASYFCTRSSKFDEYTREDPENGLCYSLMFRCVVGNGYFATHSMSGVRRPPCIPNNCGKSAKDLPCTHDLYDSIIGVTDSTHPNAYLKRHREICIYRTEQTLPVFLFAYRRTHSDNEPGVFLLLKKLYDATLFSHDHNDNKNSNEMLDLSEMSEFSQFCSSSLSSSLSSSSSSERKRGLLLFNKHHLQEVLENLFEPSSSNSVFSDEHDHSCEDFLFDSNFNNPEELAKLYNTNLNLENATANASATTTTTTTNDRTSSSSVSSSSPNKTHHQKMRMMTTEIASLIIFIRDEILKNELWFCFSSSNRATTTTKTTKIKSVFYPTSSLVKLPETVISILLQENPPDAKQVQILTPYTNEKLAQELFSISPVRSPERARVLLHVLSRFAASSPEFVGTVQHRDILVNNVFYPNVVDWVLENSSSFSSSSKNKNNNNSNNENTNENNNNNNESVIIASSLLHFFIVFLRVINNVSWRDTDANRRRIFGEDKQVVGVFQKIVDILVDIDIYSSQNINNNDNNNLSQLISEVAYEFTSTLSALAYKTTTVQLFLGTNDNMIDALLKVALLCKSCDSCYWWSYVVNNICSVSNEISKNFSKTITTTTTEKGEGEEIPAKSVVVETNNNRRSSSMIVDVLCFLTTYVTKNVTKRTRSTDAIEALCKAINNIVFASPKTKILFWRSQKFLESISSLRKNELPTLKLNQSVSTVNNAIDAVEKLLDFCLTRTQNSSSSSSSRSRGDDSLLIRKLLSVPLAAFGEEEEEEEEANANSNSNIKQKNVMKSKLLFQSHEDEILKQFFGLCFLKFPSTNDYFWDTELLEEAFEIAFGSEAVVVNENNDHDDDNSSKEQQLNVTSAVAAASSVRNNNNNNNSNSNDDDNNNNTAAARDMKTVVKFIRLRRNYFRDQEHWDKLFSPLPTTTKSGFNSTNISSSLFEILFLKQVPTSEQQKLLKQDFYLSSEYFARRCLTEIKPQSGSTVEILAQMLSRYCSSSPLHEYLFAPDSSDHVRRNSFVDTWTSLFSKKYATTISSRIWLLRLINNLCWRDLDQKRRQIFSASKKIRDAYIGIAPQISSSEEAYEWASSLATIAYKMPSAASTYVTVEMVTAIVLVAKQCKSKDSVEWLTLLICCRFCTNTAGASVKKKFARPDVRDAVFGLEKFVVVPSSASSSSTSTNNNNNNNNNISHIFEYLASCCNQIISVDLDAKALFLSVPQEYKTFLQNLKQKVNLCPTNSNKSALHQIEYGMKIIESVFTSSGNNESGNNNNNTNKVRTSPPKAPFVWMQSAENDTRWKSNATSDKCCEISCGKEFGLIFTRRHHCYSGHKDCKQLFCDDCAPIRTDNISDQYRRCCATCWKKWQRYEMRLKKYRTSRIYSSCSDDDE